MRSSPVIIVLTVLSVVAAAGAAQAQTSFGRPFKPGGFKPPASGLPTPAVRPLPGYGADGTPTYHPATPKSYATPAPKPLAPIGSIDSGDTFKPYKPAKGYSTYDHDAPGRKKTFSTY